MYKLTIYPAIEKNPEYKIEQEFKFKEDMDEAKNLAANLLLGLQDDLKVMEDYSNVFLAEMRCVDELAWSEFI